MTPRQQAIEQGSTRYFTGVPCPYGHVASRMVSTRACCECMAEKKSNWNKSNPEKSNAQKRAWRDANLEHARKLNLDNQKLHRESANARTRKWYQANTEQVKARKAMWAKRNPGKVLAKANKRHACKLQRTPKWADHAAIEKVYNLAAKFRSLGLDFHVDHEIPLRGKFVSGLHVHNNLQIIEAKANRSKSNHF